MNDIKDKLRRLIRRYEKRLEEKTNRVPDAFDAIIRQVIEDLKEVAK